MDHCFYISCKFHLFLELNPFLGFRCILLLFLHVMKNCAKLHSLHRRCGISPVFRCIWHNITAHKTFQTNISTASKETDACISVHSVHFSELTEVYLLAVCKAHILNSMAVCRNTRPQSFLSQVLGPGFRQCPDKVGTTLLRPRTNPPHTLIAWLAADLDICHLTNKDTEFFCGVSQFTPILSASGSSPSADCSSGILSSSSSKAASFPPPLIHVGSVTRSNSDKCWGGAAGARNSHKASLQPLLKFTPGTPTWDVAPEGGNCIQGILFQGHLIHPSLRALK